MLNQSLNHLYSKWPFVFIVIYAYFHAYKQLWGARCSSVVRVIAHGAMGRRIDPSWGGPIELFLASASAPRLV